MIVMMMQVKAAGRVAGQPGARLLVRRVAESHVPFAQTGSSRSVGQRGGRLRRRRLSLLLLLRRRLLLLRVRMMMLLLVLLMLRILDRRGGHRFVHRDSTPLFVQRAAMKVAFPTGASIGPVHRTAVPYHRLVNMIRALRRVDMDGGAVERVGTLLHQTTGDPVRLRLRL